MNARAISAIIRKDLKVFSQNKGVMMPSIILPLVVFGILPWFLTLTPLLEELTGVNVLNDVKWLIDLMSTTLQQGFEGYDPYQKFAIYVLSLPPL